MTGKSPGSICSAVMKCWGDSPVVLVVALLLTVFDKLQNVSLEFHTIMFVTLLSPLFEISRQKWSKLHLYILEHAFEEKKPQRQNSIQHFEFPALCSALLGLPFCPPGAIARLPASTEKSAGKFKMLYRVLNFSPEIHAVLRS